MAGLYDSSNRDKGGVPIPPQDAILKDPDALYRVLQQIARVGLGRAVEVIPFSVTNASSLIVYGTIGPLDWAEVKPEGTATFPAVYPNARSTTVGKYPGDVYLSWASPGNYKGRIVLYGVKG
jgi:hypothetical protein